MYNKFANIYDELMKDVSYEDWSKYIISILNKYNKNPKTILEMACGTGNLTKELAKNAFNITAFDMSDSMLSVAYDKLYMYNNVRLLNQNMINFDLNKKYDLIIAVCDSINYIIEPENLKNTFMNVFEHLDENGIFIFDINSKYKLKNIIGNNKFIYDKGDIYYVWENEYDYNLDIANFFLTFFVRDDNSNNTYIRFDEEHSEKAYEVYEIENKLNEVGFKSIDVYDAFTFEKINLDSERINFIVQK